MIIPDINLLLYAYDAASPQHKKAVVWLEASLSTEESVGLVPAVIFGFIRIATHPRVFRSPMSHTEAIGHVRSWLIQPNVRILAQEPALIEATLQLLERLGAAGNLVTDAQIAALAIEHGGVLHTNDTDFQRFAGLSCFNPLS